MMDTDWLFIAEDCPMLPAEVIHDDTHYSLAYMFIFF